MKITHTYSVIYTLCIFLILPAVTLMAQSKPVAIFGNKYTKPLIIYSCFYPHSAEYDIKYKDGGKWISPDKFSNYSAVIVCRIKDSKKAPWSSNQIQKIRKWIESGGVLILTADAPYVLAGHDRNLNSLEPLIGCKYYDDSKNDMKLQAPGSIIGKALNTKQKKSSWGKYGHTLTNITGAKIIVGTKKAGIITVNNIGKGKVFYFGRLLYHLPRQSNAATVKWMKMISAAILTSSAKKYSTDRKAWNPIPLGPKVSEPVSTGAPITTRKAKPTLHKLPTQGQPLTLVNNGESNTILVLADKPTSSAEKGAKAIQKYIEKISGAKLKIVSVSTLGAKWKSNKIVISGNTGKIKNFILVGKSKLTSKFNFNPSQLPPEGYKIQTKGNALLIAGRDLGKNNPKGIIHEKNQKGTQYAAYDFLERYLGISWLWPGKIGTVIPEDKTITINPINEWDAPAIGKRRLRNNAAKFRGGLKYLNLKKKDLNDRYHDSQPWFDHQKIGSNLLLHYSHAYNSYWNKYGKKHPDWFALQPDGTRKQNPHRPRIDVTNKQLIKQVAENKIKSFKTHPTLQAASISQNDGSTHNVLGMSKRARKLDPPNGHEVDLQYQQGKLRRHFKYVSLTDRYLQYDNQVAKLVAKKYPHRWLGAYAYSFTKYPPLYTKANPHLLIGFVGLNYLNETSRQNDLKRWDGWAHVAYHLLLRPNAIYFHGAVGLPVVAVHKIGHDIRHAYETGMVATDWDGGLGNWATQGLNYYVLAKIMWDPSKDVNKIVTDYCQKGFGSAAKNIHKYFNDIEDITNQSAQDAGDKSKLKMKWVHTSGGFYAAHFTPAVLSKLKKDLDDAANSAKGNKKIERRIEFLKRGLQYTTLVSSLYRAAVNKDEIKGKKLMDKRYKMYRNIMLNYPFVVNTAHAAYEQGKYFQRKFGWKKPKK